MGEAVRVAKQTGDDELSTTHAGGPEVPGRPGVPLAFEPIATTFEHPAAQPSTAPADPAAAPLASRAGAIAVALAHGRGGAVDLAAQTRTGRVPCP